MVRCNWVGNKRWKTTIRNILQTVQGIEPRPSGAETGAHTFCTLGSSADANFRANMNTPARAAKATTPSRPVCRISRIANRLCSGGGDSGAVCTRLRCPTLSASSSCSSSALTAASSNSASEQHVAELITNSVIFRALEGAGEIVKNRRHVRLWGVGWLFATRTETTGGRSGNDMGGDGEEVLVVVEEEQEKKGKEKIQPTRP